jgi:hypothetical protein
MSEDFDTRRHLGPLVNQLYVSSLCEFDERVWEVFRQHARALGPIEDGSRNYLIVRMMYLAEVTSNAIRMDATWELTPAAMSLVRDRYEQTVRFSWLVRNPDPEEFDKYERFMLAKIRNIVRNVDLETITRAIESGTTIPQWATETLTKEDQKYLEAWEQIDLPSMATKRDAFLPICDNFLSKEKLERWYNAVYRQFSSVSHYDRFAVEMVSPVPSGEDEVVVMSMRPHWPKLLILYTSLLDIIQCFEATAVCFKRESAIQFESLFLEWLSLGAKFQG